MTFYDIIHPPSFSNALNTDLLPFCSNFLPSFLQYLIGIFFGLQNRICYHLACINNITKHIFLSYTFSTIIMKINMINATTIIIFIVYLANQVWTMDVLLSSI